MTTSTCRAKITALCPYHGSPQNSLAVLALSNNVDGFLNRKKDLDEEVEKAKKKEFAIQLEVDKANKKYNALLKEKKTAQRNNNMLQKESQNNFATRIEGMIKEEEDASPEDMANLAESYRNELKDDTIQAENKYDELKDAVTLSKAENKKIQQRATTAAKARRLQEEIANASAKPFQVSASSIPEYLQAMQIKRGVLGSTYNPVEAYNEKLIHIYASKASHMDKEDEVRKLRASLTANMEKATQIETEKRNRAFQKIETSGKDYAYVQEALTAKTLVQAEEARHIDSFINALRTAPSHAILGK